MPITQSAKKALRQNVRRRRENLKRKEAYKKAVKDFRKLVTAKKIDEAKNYLTKVYQALDKAAKTNVVKKNKASRLKSRLSHLITKSTKTSS
ncbi:MAG: 30S ribosomal protein S20 [Candidatus Liptonbacteria bacterium]|nr:30S ribosomal protein S20 [Candidatus Liptonbacteria bacterium]